MKFVLWIVGAVMVFFALLLQLAAFTDAGHQRFAEACYALLVGWQLAAGGLYLMWWSERRQK